MGHLGPDVRHGTMFGTRQIAVAHEGETVVFNMDNAMNDIATAIDPSQKHIALFYKTSPFQDDAFAPANDKRQHAVAIDGQSDTDTLADQPNGLF